MSDQKTKKPMPWGRILLVASLALNLLFIGIIAGAAAKGGTKDGPRGAGDFNIRIIASAMEDNHRKALRSEIDQRRGDLPDMRQQMRGLQVQMLGLIESTPFDQSAFETTFTQQRDALGEIASVYGQALSEVISQMDDEERAAFAKRLNEKRKNGRPKGPKPRD